MMNILKLLERNTDMLFISCTIIFTTFIFGSVVFLMVIDANEIKRQTYECICKNGTLLEGRRMNFCVEKFIDLEQEPR
jgi:hypothetical protein